MRRQNFLHLEHTLDKDGRHKRRSIADGIEVLRNEGKLGNDQCAEVATVPLQLPNGEVPSMAFVICRPDPGGPAYGVPLPTSAYFSARNIGHGEIETFEISLLDGAAVHADGTVTLLSGKRLQAVNLIPMALPWELNERQKRIVYWTIKLIGAEDKCYRYGPASPDLAWLDYATLYELDVPALNVIQHQICKLDPTLQKVPGRTMAKALGACGMRQPRSGRLAMKKESASPGCHNRVCETAFPSKSGSV